MPELRALSPSEVVRALTDLPQWRLRGDGAELAIERSWQLPSPLHALLLVHALACLAETLQHHPEIVLNHAQVTVRWRTHDVAGLSALDVQAALRTQALADLHA